MFSGGGTLTLFRVRGIRIAVDWSWFLVLFLVIFWLSDFYGDVLDKPSGSTEPYLLAVASAVGFFGSIVLHELGHAFEAQRHGIGITTIRLWIFGGMAQMDRESDSPGTEFKVAAAGPAMTLLIAILLIVQMWLLTATLEAFLAGHHEAAVPGAVLSGLLFAACFGLYRFIEKVDRSARRGPP